MSLDLQKSSYLDQNYKQRKEMRSTSEWEIVGGLKDNERYEEKPQKFDGYLHKKRNAPMKGWHKVCCTLGVANSDTKYTNSNVSMINFYLSVSCWALLCN